MQGLFYQPRSLTWWIKIQQFLCCYHTHCGTSLTTSSHFICSVFLKSVIPTPVHISWYPHRLSYPQYISYKSNTGQKGIQAADGPGWFMVCMNTQSTRGACVQPWPAPRVAEASLYCHADLLYHSLSMIWWCGKLMDANRAVLQGTTHPNYSMHLGRLLLLPQCPDVHVLQSGS